MLKKKRTKQTQTLNSSSNQKKSSSLINILPDYIIENFIFPWFTTKELFFTIRAVSPEWHEMMKNIWGINIKEEMFNQIKNLSFIYEKDALTKAYEFKLQYLVNYRNLLTVYNQNTNVLNILKSCINEYIFNNNNIQKLVELFFVCLQLENGLILIKKEKNDNFLTNINNYLDNENTINEYKNNINELLDIENFNINREDFIQIQTYFNLINKDDIDNLNENSRLMYSFVQGIIEYNLLKCDVKELKNKLEMLFNKIQEETKLWPKRKKFFETAFKFLLFSKSSDEKTKFMLNLFKIFKIRNPLMEFKDESFKLMMELKEKMEEKKKEILIKKQNNENNSDDIEKVDQMFLQNILSRRLLLTKKLLIIDKFYSFYEKFKSENNNNNNNENSLIFIKNEPISLKNFLVCLIIAGQSYGEKFDEEILYQIKLVLSKNYNFEIKQIFYDDEEVKKEKEILNLKQQKQNLIIQKQKTEQVLSVLKKYLMLKENLGKNKKKYKLILYLLSKIRKGEKKNIDENVIEEIINNVNLEEIDFNEENISITEKEELENFESSDKLLNEIELTLTKQINNFFKEIEENKNDDDNNNNINNDIENNNNNINVINDNDTNEEVKVNNFNLIGNQNYNFNNNNVIENNNQINIENHIINNNNNNNNSIQNINEINILINSLNNNNNNSNKNNNK